MGPRHCCRGIRPPVRERTLHLHGFNGAAALLPRNRRRRRGSAASESGFNGAAALLPRNRHQPSRPAPSATGFNGAAALLPRNLPSRTGSSDGLVRLQWGRGIAAAESASLWGVLLTIANASMGPRHCCRGIRARRSSILLVKSSFNGAAALLPRNQYSDDGGSADDLALQWGRGIAAAESVAGAAEEHQEGSASMGPRHCCRGIGMVPRRNLEGNMSFNGAAALLPRNQRHRVEREDRKSRFNGAAALLPRNRTQNPSRSAQRAFASMGPRHCCRGILALA